MAVTLAASIDAGDKFILVDGTVGDEVQPGHRFRVDDELLEFGAFDTRNRVDRSGWYVERGLEGSTAASHAEGADIVAVSDTYGAGGPFAGGGGGGASDLETVLATGNTTGEHPIVMPMGFIDGTTDNGAVSVYGGTEAGASITAFPADSGEGGALTLQTGHATEDGSNGGDVRISCGYGVNAGRNGLIFLNLTTSDPHVAGALWSNLGIVTVSAG